METCYFWIQRMPTHIPIHLQVIDTLAFGLQYSARSVVLEVAEIISQKWELLRRYKLLQQ
jgi:hypothetical protein